MTITLNDIISLRTKIETDRKKLEEREKALRVVEAMIQDEIISVTYKGTGSQPHRYRYLGEETP